MRVAAIMPCRGRAEQTVANVRRLLATAGRVEWELICVVDNDLKVWEALGALDGTPNLIVAATPHQQRSGYWRALQGAMPAFDDVPLIANLANDLIPGHDWLQRGVEAFTRRFGSGEGLLGFNDGHHTAQHSCHFLISRQLLTRYGGWPVWYDHAFGDTELCQRAMADRVYAKAPWATLFHDHPYFGGQDDAVYAEGRAQAEADQRLYEQRRAQGWPAISR